MQSLRGGITTADPLSAFTVLLFLRVFDVVSDWRPLAAAGVASDSKGK